MIILSKQNIIYLQLVNIFMAMACELIHCRQNGLFISL